MMSQKGNGSIPREVKQGMESKYLCVEAVNRGLSVGDAAHLAVKWGVCSVGGWEVLCREGCTRAVLSLRLSAFCMQCF